MRTLYAVWSWILFAAIVVQVGLAGYGAFYAASKLGDEGATIDEDVFFDGFIAHAIFGYIVILAALIFMIIGVDRRDRQMAARACTARCSRCSSCR